MAENKPIIYTVLIIYTVPLILARHPWFTIYFIDNLLLRKRPRDALMPPEVILSEISISKNAPIIYQLHPT
jgi:hypothetical protein